jgi:arsenite/tail-anchored protein-transporting ATPase
MNNQRDIPGFLIDERWKLLLFSGKGGVGKTTASVATALTLSIRHPDRSILLVSTDPAHSLQDSLAGAQLPPNLKVVELDAQACLLNFKEKNRLRLKEIAVRGTFLDEEDINRFLELSLPGMDEIMGFLEISHWINEGTYSAIVVDTAPTGHTLRLMGMPELMREWLEALDTLLTKYRYMKKLFHGSYRKDDLDQFIDGLSSEVMQMKKLLKDSLLCRFVPVMLAEALSVEETLDLIQELKRLGINIEDIVVNRLYPESQCNLCMDIRSRQLRELSRLSREKLFSNMHLWGISMYPQEIRGLEELLRFWDGVHPLQVYNLEDRPSLFKIPPRVDNPAHMPSFDASMLLFMGKGGVGKTTLACATALQLATAYEKKRILLFSVDPAHSLSDCLNLHIGSEPTLVAAGLYSIEVDAKIEFNAFKTQYRQAVKQFLTKLMPNMDLSFDREAMERMMDLSPPGIDEIMALTTVMDFLAKDRFDMLVLDTAPTGHLIRLLELPEIIDEWLKAIFGIFLKYQSIFRLPKITARLIKISKDLKLLRAMLHNPSETAMYAVSILTEMSFSETCDLLSACDRLAIPSPHLFLNLATPDSEDPLCSSIFKRESLVTQKFVSTFPTTSQTLVYRQSDPRGINNLKALGELLYLNDDLGITNQRMNNLTNSV